MHGCTGAECTGDAGEDCDEELDPEADVRAVLVGVVACDGAHGLPPSLVLIYTATAAWRSSASTVVVASGAATTLVLAPLALRRGVGGEAILTVLHISTVGSDALHEAYLGTHELMDNGKASYLEVLTAQENLLSSQLSEASNMYKGAQAVIALYIALGGGTK